MPQQVGSVDHVIDNVYIGGVRALRCVDDLRAARITHVLKLYYHETQWDDWPEDFEVCHNSLHDGVFIPLETLQRGVGFIKTCVEAGQPVLVVCGAGISRSSTFVLAYLLERGYSLQDAWNLLHECHPEAGPLFEMWRSLIEHYKLPDTIDEVNNWVFGM